MLKLVPMPLRQYAQFFGRMTRSQYLRWLGFLLAVYVIVAWVDLRFIAPMLGYLPFEEVEEQYLTLIAAALLLIPSLASNVRRLHDVNRTGWWMVLAIAPVLIFYFSNDIGFFLYGFLSDNSLSGWIPAGLSAFAINWLPWIIIALAVLSFLPVIIWSLMKGSNEPNRYGTRQ
ncbi:MAG: DUF805 domain-containing protein [Rhizobiaceae bacterium]|nr:DUF805 domain-containing protein [Rhizobiaceae bacterium]